MEINPQSIREATDLLARSPLTPAAVPPPPPPQTVQTIMGSSQEARSGISILVSMSYESISGNLHSRDVLIRRVIHAKGEYYIDGVAMDKYAPRLIKVSHIRGIRDISSGKVYYNPYEFIQNRLGVQMTLPAQQAQSIPKPADQFAQVIERTGHEMTVLMYLVAVDGVRQTRERDKVFQYVKSRTKDLTYADQELTDYLISLAPDEESFRASLAAVLGQSEEVVQGFIETVLDVIMADGRVDPKERAFLLKIMELLEKEGYNISLPI